jgi:hypothetical protein
VVTGGGVASVEAYREVADLASGDGEVRTLLMLAVRLQGGAVRAGYPITPPAVISVGGQDVLPYNDGCPVFTQKVIAVWGSLPIFAAAGNLRDLVADLPDSEWPVPNNPYMGV